MASSLDEYPNSYDLMAIEPIEKILIKYFCCIDKMYEFQKASLVKKKEIIREIALQIDQETSPNKE